MYAPADVAIVLAGAIEQRRALVKQRTAAGLANIFIDVIVRKGHHSMHAEFLGNQIEVALVSADFRRTLADLCRAGIGPWRVYTIQPSNTTEQTYRGKPAQYAMKVCFAEHSGVVWEVIQPLWGPSIFQEYLDQGGSGFQHLAYDCSGLPFLARLEGFRARGFDFVQGGNWLNGCRFAFFMPTSGDGICIETIAFDDWHYPDSEEIVPLQSG